MRAPLRAPDFRTIAYALVAIGASAPAWIVEYPPVQDLPYHLAAIRVVHSYSDPAFGLAEHFQLTLGHTQYLFYYLAGSLLAYPFGVAGANLLLCSSYFAGTVLAMRALLLSLGRDPRLCLFAIPLLSNVLYLYGLLPFLLGVPLLFWGLAVAVRYFERPSWMRGVGLSLLAIALFYSHVIPFGLFCLGFASMFPWNRVRHWHVAVAPSLPAIVLLGWWSTRTDAGRTTRELLTQSHSAASRPLQAAVADVPNWLGNIFQDDSDEKLLIAFAALVLVCVGAGAQTRARAAPVAWRYVVVPVSCLVLYFVTPVGHDYIWPLAQRFAVLLLITAIPLLPMPSGWCGRLVASGAFLVAAGVTVNTARHFVDFQLDEVGDFDEAVAQIPPRKKVCSLIYDKASRITNHNPFLHFGSYYQVERGGVAMFTFAGYPHWPFDFRPGKAPPPGGPARRRWEWTPEQVPIQQIHPYYDYVLTRGAGFRPPPGTYRVKWEGARWSVYERE